MDHRVHVRSLADVNGAAADDPEIKGPQNILAPKAVETGTIESEICAYRLRPKIPGATCLRKPGTERGEGRIEGRSSQGLRCVRFSSVLCLGGGCLCGRHVTKDRFRTRGAPGASR
jgi:hypothetical protein